MVEQTDLVVKPDITEEELAQAMESKGPVFAGDMLDASAVDALQYIQNRHNDIVRLEASIKVKYCCWRWRWRGW